MLKNVDFYYFSPTGGTRKIGETLAETLGEKVAFQDLGNRHEALIQPEGELAVFAVPVFGGRIPIGLPEKIGELRGNGRRAVTLVVYGVRAYEDALLELNDLVSKQGFQIIGSGAFIAQHSIVTEVGAGRPDTEDMEEIRDCGRKVWTKLEVGEAAAVTVPGNRPYKPEPKMGFVPLSLDGCILCGKCENVCPRAAIKKENNRIETNTETCIVCMACVSACPLHVRRLPEEPLKKTSAKLAPLKEIRRKNEIFL